MDMTPSLNASIRFVLIRRESNTGELARKLAAIIPYPATLLSPFRWGRGLDEINTDSVMLEQGSI
jgi:hypothetical protein